jgi:hypothetical protein
LAKIFLVGCAKTKQGQASKAAELYTSPLFQNARKLAMEKGDRWYILSSKHGLLEPGQMVEPYEMTLDRMSVEEKKQWSRGVLQSLFQSVTRQDEVVFLAGNSFRRDLGPALEERGIKTAAPLQSMGIGRQLAWLMKLNQPGTAKTHRRKDLDRFYRLLAELIRANGRKVRVCNADMNWPRQGLAFYFSSTELRALDPSQRRVVRVANHASGTGSVSALWDLIREDRGGADGLGDHRRSLFRARLGEALINRSGLAPRFPQWGKGSSAQKEIVDGEAEMERLVSVEIGNMELCFLAVEDEPGNPSDRGYLYRNAIALLSGPDGPVDLPSPSWLGLNSGQDACRHSGLWHTRHTEEIYDPDFLGVFERYVAVSARRIPKPGQALAPAGWQSRIATGRNGQLQLFTLDEAGED